MDSCIFRGSLQAFSQSRIALREDRNFNLPSVKATCYVRVVNHRDELIVRAAFEVAVPLPKVNIDKGFALGRHGNVVGLHSANELYQEIQVRYVRL